MTGLNLALTAYAKLWAAALTYLAAISISALLPRSMVRLSRALLSAVASGFLFIPPGYTMFISRTQDVMLVLDSSSPSARLDDGEARAASVSFAPAPPEPACPA